MNAHETDPPDQTSDVTASEDEYVPIDVTLTWQVKMPRPNSTEFEVLVNRMFESNPEYPQVADMEIRNLMNALATWLVVQYITGEDLGIVSWAAGLPGANSDNLAESKGHETES